MDVIKTKNGVTIVVDFALTPHALTSLYESFQNMHFNKQIAIFGATGSRDKKKRPVM
jgi:UDP-N-acetylmuramoyl-L-alanyl-D-glutamate--2,6-diaminopimelate ligase